jgi:hypothetical protein
MGFEIRVFRCFSINFDEWWLVDFFMVIQNCDFSWIFMGSQKWLYGFYDGISLDFMMGLTQRSGKVSWRPTAKKREANVERTISRFVSALFLWHSQNWMTGKFTGNPYIWW